MKQRSNIQVMGGEINSTAAVQVGSGLWRCIKGTTGQYTILLPPEFKFMSATATGFAFITTQINAVAPPNDHSFTVSAGNPLTGAALDGGFYFIVMGLQV